MRTPTLLLLLLLFFGEDSVNATTKYIKLLLDQNRRMELENQLQQQRIQDFDLDVYKGEPQDLPDWAKALREQNNNT